MVEKMKVQRHREYPSVWQAAMRKAAREGTTISAVLRGMTRDYLGDERPDTAGTPR